MNRTVEKTGFGISEYHDTEQLYREFDKLISTPPRDLKPEALQNYLTKYFDEKCPKSKALYEEAKECIPGAVQQNPPPRHMA